MENSLSSGFIGYRDKALRYIGMDEETQKSKLGQKAISSIASSAIEAIGMFGGQLIGWQLNKFHFVYKTIQKLSDSALIIGTGLTSFAFTSNASNKARTMITVAATLSAIGIISLCDTFSFDFSQAIGEQILPSAGIIIGGILASECTGHSIGKLDGSEGYIASSGGFILFGYLFDFLFPPNTTPVLNVLHSAFRLIARPSFQFIGLQWNGIRSAVKSYRIRPESERHFTEILIDIGANSLKNDKSIQAISQKICGTLPRFLKYFLHKNSELLVGYVEKGIDGAQVAAKVTVILLSKYMNYLKENPKLIELHEKWMQSFNTDNEHQRRLYKTHLIDFIRDQIGISKIESSLLSTYSASHFLPNPFELLEKAINGLVKNVAEELQNELLNFELSLNDLIGKTLTEKALNGKKINFIKESFELHLRLFLSFMMKNYGLQTETRISHRIGNELILNLHKILFKLLHTEGTLGKILNATEVVSVKVIKCLMKVHTGPEKSFQETSIPIHRPTNSIMRPLNSVPMVRPSLLSTPDDQELFDFSLLESMDDEQNWTTISAPDFNSFSREVATATGAPERDFMSAPPICEQSLSSHLEDVKPTVAPISANSISSHLVAQHSAEAPSQLFVIEPPSSDDEFLIDPLTDQEKKFAALSSTQHTVFRKLSIKDVSDAVQPIIRTITGGPSRALVEKVKADHLQD